MEERERKLKRMKRSFRAARGLVRFGLGLMGLIAVFYLWYGVRVCMAPEEAFSVRETRYGELWVEMEGENISAGNVTPSYATPQARYGEISGKRLQLVNMSLGVVLVLAPISWILFMLEGILSGVILGGSPFERGICRRLKAIGWTLVYFGAAVKILYLLGIYWLALDGQARSMSYLFSFEALFTGVLVLALVKVFEYGSYLQEEYDTTL